MSVFSRHPATRVRRNKFNLSHERKMSFNMGELIPFYLDEVIPGDRFRVSSEIFLRFAPMVAPVMHRINVYTHFFFVPNRIIWEDWEDFITGGEDGLDATNWAHMQVNTTDKANFGKGKLPDYLGVPITDGLGTITQVMNLNALPFRAYLKIYNDYYRDQALTSEVSVSNGSGIHSSADVAKLCTVRKRAWEKDYFTSSRPDTQLGAEVDLGIASEFTPSYMTQSRAPGITSEHLQTDASTFIEGASTNTDAQIQNLNDPQTVTSELTINELRTAVTLQQWLELNARGGARYVESILNHFGVRLSDYRAQRPVFLGGGKNPVVISEVLNTNASSDSSWSDTAPAGQLAGHGISVGKTNGFTHGFTEHGFVIGIMSVLPRTAYQQGLHMLFKRSSKTLYFWPKFAHLGEQAITNGQIYWDYTGASAWNDTFGYTPRYSEYKHAKSLISGDMHDDFEYWHMGRIFTSPPALNTSFVEADPTHRIFAVTTSSVDKVYGQIYNKVDALRPMPVFGNPGITRI